MRVKRRKPEEMYYICAVCDKLCRSCHLKYDKRNPKPNKRLELPIVDKALALTHNYLI